MNTKKARYILFAVIILLGLTGIGVGLNMFSETHQDLSDLKPDFNIDPIDLYSAFEGNELAANKRYLNKILEIEGNISSIETPSTGTANIVIQSHEDAFGGINCSFTEPDPEYLKTLKKGDLVKIRGECSGFLMDVNLVRCVFISS